MLIPRKELFSSASFVGELTLCIHGGSTTEGLVQGSYINHHHSADHSRYDLFLTEWTAVQDGETRGGGGGRPGGPEG